MTWWDVVDILIVSLLIYEALKLIRGTRAMQMATGGVLVLLLFYISQLFPLQTVSWLIRNVLAYVVIAAIVLFQSDIRRALSHIGRAPFFRYFARTERAAGNDRRSHDRRRPAGQIKDRRHHRLRTGDRTAELRRERHSRSTPRSATTC